MQLNVEMLEQRLQDAEARFNAAKVRTNQAEAELETANNECLRIQGEFRALKDLLARALKDEADLEPPFPSLPPPVLVEDVPTDALEKQRKVEKEAKNGAE